jgi:lipoprotein Spr
MKHLFFVAVATGIFTGTSISAKSQTNVNIERLSEQSHPNTKLKFIEGIEIEQGKVSDVGILMPVKNRMTLPASAPVDINLSSSVSSIEKCSSLQFKYAMLMEREVESFNNLSLYNFIEEWWGTRYRYGGCDKKGVDCSSFSSQLILATYKINLPRTAREQYQACDKIATEDMKEGDLVFFNTRGGVSHVGVYLGDNYFVHSSVSSGVTISSLLDDYYSKHFISGGRPVVE